MLNLMTLGGLTVRESSSPLDVARIRKPLALLAVVAAAGEGGVSRDRLQAFFWPESDPERARGALKQAQYLIRQALGVDPFSAQGSNVALDASVIVADVAQFRERVKAGALVDAVALYGGPFLDGVYLKDVPEFEQWVDAERARLAATYARTLERLAADAAESHDLTAAADWWGRRAELDRVDGRVARRYMEALAAAGDRERAIRHARVHAELVRAELGAEPNPELIAFAEHLRASPRDAPRQATNPAEPGDPPPLAAQRQQRDLAPGQSQDLPELPLSVRIRRGLMRRRRSLGIGAGVIGVATLLGLLARQRSSSAAGAIQVNPLLAASGRAVSAGIAPATAPANLNEAEPSRNIGRVLVAPLENASGDTSAATFGRLAADWMASGLAQTGLVDVVDAQTTAGLRLRRAQAAAAGASTPELDQLAADADAKTLVRGRYFTTHDSLVVQVMIEDVENGQLVRTLPRIAVPTGDYAKALAMLRERIGGAFATLVDPRLESLVDGSTRAPSLVAYRAYADGLDCYIRSELNPRECNPAPSFEEAIHADSSWTLPYIWLMYTYTNGRPGAIDSLIGVLDRRHQLQSELDRSGVEFFKRERSGDMEGALRAARRAAALAPRSNWTYQAAFVARQLSRYNESLTLLRQLDPEHGWVRGWWGYVQSLALVEDALGMYRAELEDMEKAEKRDPGKALYISFRLMALAGLGDSITIVRVVDSLIANPPVDHVRLGRVLQAVVPAANARGHHQLARQLADRCLAAIDPPSASTPEQRNDLAVRGDCLYAASRWADARVLWERLLSGPAPPVGSRDWPAYAFWNAYAERSLVRIETRLGDSASAALHMARRLALSDPVNRTADSLLLLAHVAAIRGMQARTVELLRQMPASPGWHPASLLDNPDFVDLMAYPPFRAFVAPRG